MLLPDQRRSGLHVLISPGRPVNPRRVAAPWPNFSAGHGSRASRSLHPDPRRRPSGPAGCTWIACKTPRQDHRRSFPAHAPSPVPACHAATLARGECPPGSAALHHQDRARPFEAAYARIRWRRCLQLRPDLPRAAGIAGRGGRLAESHAGLVEGPPVDPGHDQSRAPG